MSCVNSVDRAKAVSCLASWLLRPLRLLRLRARYGSFLLVWLLRRSIDLFLQASGLESKRQAEEKKAEG